MKPMTPEEMRKLDVFCAEILGRCVFVENPADNSLCNKCGQNVWYEMHQIPSVTTDPAASDALDDAILKKFGYEGYSAWVSENGTYIMRSCEDHEVESSPDKKICRALFARKLWEAK